MRLPQVTLALGVALSLALTVFAQQPGHGPANASSPAGPAGPASPASPAGPASAATPPSPPQPQGRNIPVRLPAEASLAAPAALKPQFPKGLAQGMGFGLNCALTEPGGVMVFHSVTGRGPTLAGPMVQQGDALASSALFVLPDYTPSVVFLRVTSQWAEPLAVLPIKDSTGASMRCLPPAPAKSDISAEVPLDLGLKRLPFDSRGIDPQGVAQDFKRNSLWVCDAYSPTLFRLEVATGVIREAVRPGEGLPTLLTGQCKPGLAFNGVCLTPTGLVVTIFHSPWEEQGVRGIFSRIVEYDPESLRVRQFAYPLDLDAYKTGRDIRTGAIVNVGENKFLVVEQCRTENGEWDSKVFAADVTQAVSINTLKTADEKPLETVTDPVLWAKDHVRMARKSLVLDLTAAGWPPDREVEGMALLPDGRTLAVMAGGKFGMKAVVENPGLDAGGAPVVDPAAYVLADKGALLLNGAPTKASIAVKPDPEGAELRMFPLAKPAMEF